MEKTTEMGATIILAGIAVQRETPTRKTLLSCGEE
jgi:hypothetical protein